MVREDENAPGEGFWEGEAGPVRPSAPVAPLTTTAIARSWGVTHRVLVW